MQDALLERYASSLPDTRPKPYIARARAFLKWLGNKELSAENIRKWLDKLKRDGYSEGTIAQDYAIIRRLVNVNGLPWPFRRSDAPLVSEQGIYAPALDPDDIKAMVNVVLGKEKSLTAAPRADHRAFLALSTIYGLRRIEMQEMSPEFLDEENQLLFVQTAKRGRQRYHLIPEIILPHLVDWGFERPMSSTGLSRLFDELKGMIGLKADEVGWHSIRRSAVRDAFEAGLSEPTVMSFYRWKRSTSDIALRYATSRIVGRGREYAALGLEDRRVDEAVFAVHPFLSFWK